MPPLWPWAVRVRGAWSLFGSSPRGERIAILNLEAVVVRARVFGLDPSPPLVEDRAGVSVGLFEAAY